jgi:hypothetical protein
MSLLVDDQVESEERYAVASFTVSGQVEELSSGEASVQLTATRKTLRPIALITGLQPILDCNRAVMLTGDVGNRPQCLARCNPETMLASIATAILQFSGTEEQQSSPQQQTEPAVVTSQTPKRWREEGELRDGTHAPNKKRSMKQCPECAAVHCVRKRICCHCSFTFKTTESPPPPPLPTIMTPIPSLLSHSVAESDTLTHDDMCHVCLFGGELYLCDTCPNAVT